MCSGSNYVKISLKESKKQEGKIKVRLIKFFALAFSVSSSLDKCYPLYSVSKNKKTCFNFLPLSEMRHSYLRCPTSNRCTIPVYYRWFYSEYPTSKSGLSYSECPTLYKCALLRIDTIRSPVSYKNPTPVGAILFIYLFNFSLKLTENQDISYTIPT